MLLALGNAGIVLGAVELRGGNRPGRAGGEEPLRPGRGSSSVRSR